MNVLITAGGTTETIDPVRKITNTATGRLGSLIAKEFVKQGKSQIDRIFYICEKNTLIPSLPCLKVVSVMGVDEAKRALTDILTANKIDAVIHSMAVSDYTVESMTTVENLAGFIADKLYPLNYQNFKNESTLAEYLVNLVRTNDCLLDNSKKIPSSIDNLMLMMKRTPKLINLVKRLQPSTFLVGFKLLNNVSEKQLLDAGYDVLIKNSCDLVLANDLKKINGNKHVGLLISPDRSFTAFRAKAEIAHGIVQKVLTLTEKEGHRI